MTDKHDRTFALALWWGVIAAGAAGFLLGWIT